MVLPITGSDLLLVLTLTPSGSVEYISSKINLLMQREANDFEFGKTVEVYPIDEIKTP